MRKRYWKVALAVLAGLVVVVQFVPVDRANPPVTSRMAASPAARDALRRACDDCHSNETSWPWYSRVAPVSWWVAGHVRDGRRELNFSEWVGSGTAQQQKRLAKTAREIARGKMPPWYYRLAHPAARLSAADVTALNSLGTEPAVAASAAPAPATAPAAPAPPSAKAP